MSNRALRGVVPTSITVTGVSSSTNGSRVNVASVTTLDINGVFTDTYQVYDLLFNVETTAAANASIRYQWLSNGVPASATSYVTQIQAVDPSNNALHSRGTASSGFLHVSGSVDKSVSGQATLYGTRRSGDWNMFACQTTSASPVAVYFVNGSYQQNGASDGIRIYPSSGSMSGDIAIYGYQV